MAEAEIRTLLNPLTTGHFLVPNSVVAEILEYSSPRPFKKAPRWLLGELEWHGWQVPVVSFLQIINTRTQDPVTKKSRILIIKTLGESIAAIDPICMLHPNIYKGFENGKNELSGQGGVNIVAEYSDDAAPN